MMSVLLNHFIDMNIKKEKKSQLSIENRNKRILKYLIKEGERKLGDEMDYIMRSIVTLMSCILSYESSYKKEYYDEVTKVATFAKLPSYDDYEIIINNIVPKTKTILKDLFCKIRNSNLSPKFMNYTIEFLVTLNSDIDYLKMFSSLFKTKKITA